MLRCSLGKHANNISFMLLFNDHIYTVYIKYIIWWKHYSIFLYISIEDGGCPILRQTHLKLFCTIWSFVRRIRTRASWAEQQSTTLKHQTWEKMWFNHQTHQKPWDLTIRMVDVPTIFAPNCTNQSLMQWSTIGDGFVFVSSIRKGKPIKLGPGQVNY